MLSPELATHFEQIDTELGEKSALLDKGTGPEVALAHGLAYIQVHAELSAGGRFEGWRYAAAQELREFFPHFTGTSNGISRDPLLAAQFQ